MSCSTIANTSSAKPLDGVQQRRQIRNAVRRFGHRAPPDRLAERQVFVLYLSADRGVDLFEVQIADALGYW